MHDGPYPIQLGQPIDLLVNTVHWVQTIGPILTKSYCGVLILSLFLFLILLVKQDCYQIVSFFDEVFSHVQESFCVQVRDGTILLLYLRIIKRHCNFFFWINNKILFYQKLDENKDNESYDEQGKNTRNYNSYLLLSINLSLSFLFSYGVCHYCECTLVANSIFGFNQSLGCHCDNCKLVDLIFQISMGHRFICKLSCLNSSWILGFFFFKKVLTIQIHIEPLDVLRFMGGIRGVAPKKIL